MSKFNWGYGVIIFFIFYFAYLICTVIASLSVDHSLVVEDYYQHDIAYQDEYVDASENRNKLSHDLSIVIDDTQREIYFDFGANEKGIRGEVLFYRPSNKKMDTNNPFQLKMHESRLQLPMGAMQSGKWVMKIRWNDGVRDYYKEENLII